MTVILSVGRWGGIYIHRGYSCRLCLGFFAVTVLPCDIDTTFMDIKNEAG
jgi:hypothetical protein